MNIKIKALSEWYLELAKNDNGFRCNGMTCKQGPDLDSDLSSYRINLSKQNECEIKSVNNFREIK